MDEKTFLDSEMTPDFSGTHYLYFFAPNSLTVVGRDEVTPPFDCGIDYVRDSRNYIGDLDKAYIILEKTFTGEITQQMLADFQRPIAGKELEKNYISRQAELMNESESYDEYLTKETTLKKLYFEVKFQIKSSLTPLKLNLNLAF